jgi:hypothetical protein
MLFQLPSMRRRVSLFDHLASLGLDSVVLLFIFAPKVCTTCMEEWSLMVFIDTDGPKLVRYVVHISSTPCGLFLGGLVLDL